MKRRLPTALFSNETEVFEAGVTLSHDEHETHNCHQQKKCFLAFSYLRYWPCHLDSTA